MSITQYVAGLLFADMMSKVLLIRKSHPEWMKGKLNGIGGHIEDNETASEAMHREFREETGLDIGSHWKEFATLRGYSGDNNKPWVVYWYTSSIDNWNNYIPRTPAELDEPVDWYTLSSLNDSICNTHVMPNLLWLIHMAKASLEGIDHAESFVIHEQYSNIPRNKL